jgi:guanylate kinase
MSETGRMPGSLYIVAAPSGAGKSTLVNALLAREPGMELSISHTTRPPRPGESDGEHYHFATPEEFQRLIDGNQLLEHALVHGNHYGTARSAVEPRLAAGRDVLLEIDFQGARSVRRVMPEAVGIFIRPPSREELERRLHSRAQDSSEVIARRLQGSREEIRHALEFDYIIVNDRFEQALEDLGAIVRGQRLRTSIQNERVRRLIDSLLA